jgi:hypothetical protein
LSGSPGLGVIASEVLAPHVGDGAVGLVIVCSANVLPVRRGLPIDNEGREGVCRPPDD